MAFNDDEKPRASNNGSTKGLVTIKTPTYSKDDAALTADAVTAVVELNATSSTAIREGLDLVVVLDVSRSMAGVKLQSMKKAMHFVIKKLTPVDRLCVVTFSNSATRHCPLRSVTQAAQAELKAIVDGLVIGPGTNIEAGVDTALAVVAGRATTKARTPNVFLMSDGQQNNKTDARRAEPGKVGIYTFGFGKDADHRLLSDLAKKSPGGTFSSVPDGGNVSAPFSQLLGGLLTVVAQDVQLTLTPKTDEPRDLGTMFVGPGTDYTQITDGNTGVITIKFGTLFSGETRKVTVNLTLLDSADKTDYDASLAEAQHRYTAQDGVQNQTPQDIQIKRTPKPSQSASGKVQAVLAEMARRQHAGAIGKARALADGKNLHDARYKLAEAQNALEDIVVVDDAAEKLVGMLRTELQQMLSLMGTQELYEAEGRPYALASETSHGRQRFAARGGNMDAVRLFATPRMDAYLEQAKRFEEDPTAPLPSADDDVKQESAANSRSPVGFYIRGAIKVLQKIEKFVEPSNN